jgi:hypothetical protein
VIPIEGYGDIMITITTPGGPMKVGLVDAAYILAFYATIASLKKFIEKGVHMDSEHNWLQ